MSPTLGILRNVTAPFYCLEFVDFTALSSSVLCTQGQCFVAINPENFAPGFTDRMSDLLSIQRGMDPVSRPCSYISMCQNAKMIFPIFPACHCCSCCE